MDITNLIIFLLVGGVAGWLAGMLFKGRGFGVLGDVVLGAVGAFIGQFVLQLFGLAPTHIVGSLVSATLGAIILLGLIRTIKRV